jgi:hypothetical protein
MVPKSTTRPTSMTMLIEMLDYPFRLLLGYCGLIAPPQAASSEEMEVSCKL